MIQAAENLAGTYFHLGLATTGAWVQEEVGYRACLGELEHPICNFATRLRLDPWTARRLRALAASRPAFHVYSALGDEPEHAAEILEQAGFRMIYRLAQMVAEGAEHGEQAEMRIVEGEGRRLEVARFMAEQFFGRQPGPFRRRVAEATARASALDLLVREERGALVAAAMVSREGGALGIYNLCVASSRRGRGIGAAVVRWLRAEARRRETFACLQCDPRLEAWYEDLGFRTIGPLDVYALPKESGNVIMSGI